MRFTLLVLAGLLCCSFADARQQPPADSASAPPVSRPPRGPSEKAAWAALLITNTACVTYSTTYGIGFPGALSFLGPGNHPNRYAADLLDAELAAGVKNGYTYSYTPGREVNGIVPSYTIRADPIEPAQPDSLHFWTDQSGIVRSSVSAEGIDVAQSEAAVEYDLSRIRTACVLYFRRYQTGYPQDLSLLGPSDNPNPNAAGLLDADLSTGSKDGYIFKYDAGTMRAGSIPSYVVHAFPAKRGQPGTKHYYMDATGVIRANALTPANATDPPIVSAILPPRAAGSRDQFPATERDPSVASPPASASTPPPPGPLRIRVSGAVAQAKLIVQVQPVYPPLARQARIEGTVALHVIIAKDGTMQQIEVRSGPPLLVTAAVEAVKQWRYKPTLLQDIPVEVETFIDVTFKLGPPPKSGSPDPDKPQ